MFSQSVDYALRATVFLAMNSDKLMTTDQISQATKVPAPYLAKIIQSLHRAGIIASQRGVKGGSQLRRSPEEITVLEVMNAVDPIKRINYCPLGIKSHGVNLCSMHNKLDEAFAIVEDVLANSSIQDLLTKPTLSIPLCEKQ